MLKKQILSLMLTITLLSGLSGMVNTDYRRLPKRELINRLIIKDSSLNRSDLNKKSKKFVLNMLETEKATVIAPKVVKPKEVLHQVNKKTHKVSLFRRLRPIIALGTTAALTISSIATYIYFNKFEQIEPVELIIEPNWADNIINYFGF